MLCALFLAFLLFSIVSYLFIMRKGAYGVIISGCEVKKLKNAWQSLRDWKKIPTFAPAFSEHSKSNYSCDGELGISNNLI